MATLAGNLYGVGFASRLAVWAAIIAVVTCGTVTTLMVASLPIICHLILPPGWISVPPVIHSNNFIRVTPPRASGQPFEKDPDAVSKRRRRRAYDQCRKP
jgi:hypothetical protein